MGEYSPNIKSIVDPDIPGSTIADMAIIPDINIYDISGKLKLSILTEKLLPLFVIGLK